MFEKQREKRKEEFFSHIGGEVEYLYKSGDPIDSSNVPERMNSYESHLLSERYTDKYFLERLKYYLIQATNEFNKLPDFVLPQHYNEAIKRKLIFDLIERFEKLINN